MNKGIVGCTIAMVSLLGGCSVTQEMLPEQAVPDELYLRGVFNWWEAEQVYLLSSSVDSDVVFSTTADLIADGQPYDFRFADENWSPGANCGYASEQDEVVQLDQPVTADCDTENNHFQFTPSQTDTYRFTIDFSNPSQPRVVITKA